MLGKMLDRVREQCPLVHNITNYVTVNDCANILLACGGSPIMADDVGEAAEITSICQALNINIGTLNARTIPSMKTAGFRAHKLGHPIVLDPVGAGASALRTETARMLLSEIHPTVVRGNMSEIKTLSAGSGTTRGVDADTCDQVTKENLPSAVAFVKEMAAQTGAVIAVTGAIDIVADSDRAFCIFNGSPKMSLITGTGCQLSAMTAAFIAANPEDVLTAAAAAVAAMGVCGEIGLEHLAEYEGNSTYRNRIIDAVSHLTGDELERRARYEIR